MCSKVVGSGYLSQKAERETEREREPKEIVWRKFDRQCDPCLTHHPHWIVNYLLVVSSCAT